MVVMDYLYAKENILRLGNPRRHPCIQNEAANRNHRIEIG